MVSHDLRGRSSCRRRCLQFLSHSSNQARLTRQIRSEEHTSELQSPCNLVCRLLLEKKKKFHHVFPSSPQYAHRGRNRAQHHPLQRHPVRHRKLSHQRQRPIRCLRSHHHHRHSALA